jgi:hypothetical protein
MYGKTNPGSPCLECIDRDVGCHSNCERYKVWKASFEAKKIEQRQRVKLENIATDYKVEQNIRRRLKRR